MVVAGDGWVVGKVDGWVVVFGRYLNGSGWMFGYTTGNLTAAVSVVRPRCRMVGGHREKDGCEGGLGDSGESMVWLGW